MLFFAASEAPPRPESMKFPVNSLLAGNLAFPETSSQLTPPSSGESTASLPPQWPRSNLHGNARSCRSGSRTSKVSFSKLFWPMSTANGYFGSRNPPGRGGRVHGLLRQSKLLPRSQRANREPPFGFGGEHSVVRSTPTKSLSADQ